MSTFSMPWRRAAFAVASVVLVVVASSACGGNDPAGSTSATANAGGALPADVPQIVTVGVGAPLGTIDPDQAVSDVDVMSLSLIAGTLLRQTPDGVKPSLAKQCSLSPDRLSYTCSLRPDLKFSDGSPLGSADVVATFERTLADASNANAGLVASLNTVSATDGATVVFHLKHPAASFPLALTEPLLSIYPANGVASKDFFLKPVSAGPYSLASTSPSGLEFSRNPNYPADLQPVVPTIKFRVVVDPNTRLLQLQTGQIDIAHSMPASLASQVTAPAKPYVVSRYGGVYIQMNDTAGPLQNVNVRKAISAAVNRDQINKIAYLGKNKRLGSFLPSIMEGHDSNLPTTQDLSKAKELLKGTVCENGCNLSIMERAGFPPYDTIATVIQQNLAQIGVTVTIQTYDQATLSANEENGNFEMEAGDLWDVVDSPELVMLTYGLTPGGGIKSLWSRYDSAPMSSLIEKLAATSDPTQRATILGQINALFAQDLPFVPLTDFSSTWASRISPRVIALTAGGVYQVGTRDAGPGQ